MDAWAIFISGKTLNEEVKAKVDAISGPRAVGEPGSAHCPSIGERTALTINTSRTFEQRTTGNTGSSNTSAARFQASKSAAADSVSLRSVNCLRPAGKQSIAPARLVHSQFLLACALSQPEARQRVRRPSDKKINPKTATLLGHECSTKEQTNAGSPESAGLPKRSPVLRNTAWQD